MAGWLVETDVDDAAAYAAFETDRLWCGYAIADLDPPFRAYSRVAIARRGAEMAACLVLRHPDFTSVVPHGPADGLGRIVERIELPRRTHLFALKHHLATLRQRFRYHAPVPMVRMVVDGASFRLAGDAVAADRLGPDDLPALSDLYSAYVGNAFHPDQLAAGVFYGLRDGKRLLAAAGTHVVSERYGIAAVGSIYTRPEARGRGLAGAVTGAVVAELLAGTCHDVILNVAVANEAARRVYARLGFRDHCRHFEGLACAREA